MLGQLPAFVLPAQVVVLVLGHLPVTFPVVDGVRLVGPLHAFGGRVPHGQQVPVQK